MPHRRVVLQSTKSRWDHEMNSTIGSVDLQLTFNAHGRRRKRGGDDDDDDDNDDDVNEVEEEDLQTFQKCK